MFGGEGVSSLHPLPPTHTYTHTHTSQNFEKAPISDEKSPNTPVLVLMPTFVIFLKNNAALMTIFVKNSNEIGYFQKTCTTFFRYYNIDVLRKKTITKIRGHLSKRYNRETPTGDKFHSPFLDCHG